MKKYTFISIFLLLGFSSLNAQTFGFGCLGLSGFYGGYGIHTYEASGLNQSLNSVYNNLSPQSGTINFEKATGFRAGANILRADFNKVFITAKGFFQFSKETKNFEFATGTDPSKLDMELITNHWGIGIDFGFPVFSFLNLKLIEGGVTFYNIEFKEKLFVNDEEISDEAYTNDETEIGYYVGTGLIINLIEGYISIEGSAMYHFYKIDSVQNSDGISYPIASVNSPFIEKGGFAAAVQLNIGFPL